MEETKTMMNPRRVVLLLLGAATLAVAACASWYALTPTNTVAPDRAATQWAEKLKLPYRGAACTTMDTDGDGYVTCVLALDGPDRVYFQGLQCGELGSRKAGGCKPDAKNPEVQLVMTVSTVSRPAPATARREPE